MAYKFDIDAMYHPYPHQKKFHESTKKFRLIGGAAGPGKTEAIIWEGNTRSTLYDFPVSGAIFRSSFPELEATIIRKTLEKLPSWSFKYNQQQHVLKFWNGSTIDYCYAESDEDVLRYKSREWDWIGVDELTLFTKYKFLYLISRLRTTKPLKTKFFAGTNPGGIGHQYCKERWIDKVCDDEGYDPDEYDFIPAKIQDNIALMTADPHYVDNLKMLPEQERKALLYGDWDVYAGQFFSEWSREVHVVKPFEVPENWQLVLGWDEGTKAPRAVYLAAIDNDKHVWIIWEYYRKGENILSAANNIKTELINLGYWSRISRLVIDPSIKKNSEGEGTSSFGILEQLGFGFKNGEIQLANNDRREGWRILRMYLAHKPYEEPLIKVFETCPNLIKTLPELIYYETSSSGKKDDLDTRGDDHAADSVRYILMSLNDLPARAGGNISGFSGLKIMRREYVPRH